MTSQKRIFMILLAWAMTFLLSSLLCTGIQSAVATLLKVENVELWMQATALARYVCAQLVALCLFWIVARPLHIFSFPIRWKSSEQELRTAYRTGVLWIFLFAFIFVFFASDVAVSVGWQARILTAFFLLSCVLFCEHVMWRVVLFYHSQRAFSVAQSMVLLSLGFAVQRTYFFDTRDWASFMGVWALGAMVLFATYYFSMSSQLHKTRFSFGWGGLLLSFVGTLVLHLIFGLNFMGHELPSVFFIDYKITSVFIAKDPSYFTTLILPLSTCAASLFLVRIVRLSSARS